MVRGGAQARDTRGSRDRELLKPRATAKRPSTEIPSDLMKAVASARIEELPKPVQTIRPADFRPDIAPESFFTVHAQDARRLELLLSPYSSPSRPLITSTITSPPYGRLKDYGHPSQIGHGQPNDEYLVDLRRIFRSIHAHTKPEGSMWVVADTLREKRSQGEVWPMQLLPFQLVQQAEKVGWILRDIVVWIKDKTLPWSGRGRMRNGFEYVLFFIKSPSFKYHVHRLREPNELEQWWVRYPERYNPQGKAPTNVWAVPIPVQGSWANTTIQHACPLPADLVERMLLLSTDDGDVVLDPFAGSGVVVAEAKRLKRKGIGTELVDRYVQAFHSTVLPEITERRGADVVQDRSRQSERLKETILDLRSVKYPKVLMLAVRKADTTLPRPFAAYVFRRAKPTSDDRLSLQVVIVLRDGDMNRAEEYKTALLNVCRQKPASKFGVAPQFAIEAQRSLSRLHRGRRLWAYVDGKAHSTAGICTRRNVFDFSTLPARHNVPLIVSNVHVNEHPRPLREPES
ncbi:MAG TPA: DNA methyltransferase [Solirubrobacterales bacterium]